MLWATGYKDSPALKDSDVALLVWLSRKAGQHGCRRDFAWNRNTDLCLYMQVIGNVEASGPMSMSSSRTSAAFSRTPRALGSSLSFCTSFARLRLGLGVHGPAGPCSCDTSRSCHLEANTSSVGAHGNLLQLHLLFGCLRRLFFRVVLAKSGSQSDTCPLKRSFGKRANFSARA